MDHLSAKTHFIFDAFGTLFQIRPIGETLESIMGRSASELLTIWRRKQLEYTWLRSQMEAYVPFDEVTNDSLSYAMRKLDIRDDRVKAILSSVYQQPELMPGAKALLEKLATSPKKAAILSNGTPSMLERGARKTGIADLLTQLISVDRIGIYKPNPKVYQMALTVLDIGKEQAVFVSSNQWDVSGASVFGLDTVWVNHSAATRESLPFGNVVTVASLAEFQEKL